MSYITTKNQYVTVAGQQIAYRELGQGKSAIPLVMLVHLAATLDNWDPKLLDLLAEKQHVIVVDLPGVGASQGKVAPTIPGMAEQAIEILKTLGHERINLLGLSMGGMIAQEIVRIKGGTVNRLILAGTGPRGGLEMDRVTGKTFRYMLKAGLERIDPKRYIFYNHDEEGKIEANKVLGRMGMRRAEHTDKDMNIPGFLTQLKAIKRWGKSAKDDMRYITQPTLIVNGEKDMQVPTENSYVMHEKVAGSKLIIYPKAGHGSIFQYADEFSKELLAFLEA
ncbi:alpha/beta fold hydrolase [Streptococcus sp. zg-86]|uniref:Alpha/beta fold hydrolase n=1 Tax=Streptococcus zhangguiae TaxID=2664091 RepID=A0A6I4REH5_9STRE|nr:MULTISPECIES: alpha/beta hydrolase [unclassified Streptococcus]MTB63903.1 alpha/beta fold hydrolase [Streptococcus sp. zg-86]MTB90214.1 alpha/beta fold hydrolase [Streptococcus sp. zg-36]MWV55884.1 alpha/beta fold hydrolase [Streptococcus sp. zg-70]QTH48685.1 alpha/beta hydrolase [Streptococcus sp. zg-86]